MHAAIFVIAVCIVTSRYFYDLFKDNLLGQHTLADIDAAERWIQGRLLFDVALEIGHTLVEVHDLEIMIPKHTKAFLALKKANNANQHSERNIQIKQSIKHIAFDGIRRIADYVVALRRFCGEEILTVCNMGGNHGVAMLPKQLHKQAILRIKGTPYCYGGGGGRYLNNGAIAYSGV